MRIEHNSNIPNERTAIAPYNFVRLPEAVVPSDIANEIECAIAANQNPKSGLSKPRLHATYAAERHTGSIECTLTTAAPLYVRCALKPEQLSALENTEDDELVEQLRKQPKNTPEFFYTLDPKSPVIPGSSLRGLFRNLIEIGGFGKIQYVDGQRRFFFRAVAAPKSSVIGEEYKKFIKGNVKAGYLRLKNSQWYIQVATIKENTTFCWFKPKNENIEKVTNSALTRYSNENFHVAYAPVSFGTLRQDKYGKLCTNEVASDMSLENQGCIVSSGNMSETSADAINTPRKNYCIVFEPTDIYYKINPQALEDYRNALTDFQSSEPFDPQNGMLQPGRPVFFVEPTEPHGEVIYFGHSPNFRIPYRKGKADHATSALDCVPEALRAQHATIDIAEAIFGFVRDKQPNNALAGRVFFSNAHLDQQTGAHTDNDIFLRYQDPQDPTKYTPIIPAILATPKPTTFQHYLVQPQAQAEKLSHYSSDDAQIRGHKLYWHQGNPEQLDMRAADPTHRQSIEADIRSKLTQYTCMYPVKAGITFTFSIRFENLTAVELGALLWVLAIASDDQYRLKLGMGKPLGMGAIKLAHTLTLDDRQARYQQLFDAQGGWNTPTSSGDEPSLIETFKQHVISKLSDVTSTDENRMSMAAQFDQHPRIRELLTMLEWRNGKGLDFTHFTGTKKTGTALRYMEIERSTNEPYLDGAKPRDNKINEYSSRRVLPLPCQVAGKPCKESMMPKEPRSQQANVGSANSAQDEKQTLRVGDVFNDLVHSIERQTVFVRVPDVDPDTAIAVIEPKNLHGKHYVADGKQTATVKILSIRQQGDLTVYYVEPVNIDKKG